jgi:integrase
VGSTAERVARLAAGGQRPSQISKCLGLAKATVTYHLRKLGVAVGRGYVGRRAVCEVLGRGGLRASELCDLKIGNVRLHVAEGVQLRIVDAKTAAGERIVVGTPDMAEAIVEHLDRLRREGMPTGPDAYLIPNTRGGRMSRQRVAKIVREAAELASERLVAKGLPPLPTTTPHSLRRTFISIALRASKFDLKWVQDQVGHEDSTMTTDVYNQLQRRVVREHGPTMDQMLREARATSASVAVVA